SISWKPRNRPRSARSPWRAWPWSRCAAPTSRPSMNCSSSIGLARNSSSVRSFPITTWSAIPSPCKSRPATIGGFTLSVLVMVLEYVSKNNKRKDYEDNFRKYERELKVPYYLLFYPDNEELTLFHRRGSKYVSVKPNAAGRLAIPELELEVALLDGWVRFWFR